MLPTHAGDVWHMTVSYEHKKVAQKRREAFIVDMDLKWRVLSDTINEMAEKHDKYILFLSSNKSCTNKFS